MSCSESKHLTAVKVQQQQKRRAVGFGCYNLFISISHQGMGWDSRSLDSLSASTTMCSIICGKSLHLSISQFPFVFPKMVSFSGQGPGSHSGSLGATEVQKYSNTRTPWRPCSCSICRQSHLIIAVWIRFG